MRQITIENGVSFELNQNDFTAKIIHSPKASGNIFLPRSIDYQTQKYIIMHIDANAFQNNAKIKKLSFSDDSSLLSIGKNSFSRSSIIFINLPPSVEELQEGWCSYTFNLNKVTISPKNPNFKYLDDKQQIILGKSDKSSEIFDVLVFASRDVIKATIPSYVKHISSFCFNECEKLQTVFISENSKLLSIGKKAFSSSIIRSLYIPASVEELQEGWCLETGKLTKVVISPHNRNFKYLDEKHQIIVGKSDKNSENFDVLVFASREINQVTIPANIKHISSFCFEDCENLRTVVFSENSQLRSIGKNAFTSSKIGRIHIPASVEELQEGCFFEAAKLKKMTISPENLNFKYLDEKHQIIVGKSDKNSENFDVIVFANRDISIARIPPSIKYINSYAFYNCKLLKKIIFLKNSELKNIGAFAFSHSSIEKITIPKSVEVCGRFAFSYCNKLREVKFEKGAKLHSIPNCMFYYCSKLKTIEILEDSELKTIGKSAFESTKIEKIYIPSKVEELFEGWLSGTSRIKEITISPKNRFFKFLDINHQIIRGMGDDKLDTIIYGRNDIKDIKIPFYIKYIKKFSFDECSSLKKVEFPENSELKIIEDCAFRGSSIEWINIPSTVEELQEGWCKSLSNLKCVVISPKNENYKYLDDAQKIIVTKSDKSTDVFDVIVFVSRDIEEVTIPSYIKRIHSFAFQECRKLKKIEFQENSELHSIGLYSFSSTNIAKITIPKSVEFIEDSAFALCHSLEDVVFEKESKLQAIPYGLFSCSRNLQKVEIPDDSSIRYIGENAFIFNIIQKFFIPSKCEYFYEGLCFNNTILSEVTVSKSNPFFKNCEENEKLILGKSDNCNENFDVIICACKDLKEVKIPSYIKSIGTFAFVNCEKLKKLDFPCDSQLEIIERCAFSECGLECLTLPRKVYSIESSAFDSCENIKQFEFLGDFLLNKFGFLKLCTKLMIASFPNLQEIIVKSDDFKSNSPDFSLFICAGAKVNLLE
ncbi:hypothetical protein M9Y10_027856 [Tritrichomonas musculus]|uniref:Surface antigen BspA-like n=1 Tax=Tritrichomonas musculus TaxID=1915356 RepID=A0ABR2H456_9EUKA